MTASHLDIERARFNMIEQQIRPWEVLDQTVLDLLCVVKRELFVPAAYRSMAFVDTEIPLNVGDFKSGETMLAPRVEARVLQELTVRNDDLVLEVGAGSGYMAALLAHRARHVTTLEIIPELHAFAEENLRRAHVANVKVVQGDGAQGFALGHELDVIVLSGAVPFVPDAFLKQLKVGGRLLAFVGESPVQSAEIIKRTGATSFSTVKLFETNIKPLHNVAQHSHFRF